MPEEHPTLVSNTSTDAETGRNGNTETIRSLDSEKQSVQATSGAKCNLCMDGRRGIDLTETNILFLENRIMSGNLNEAIDIARVAWDQFPRLRESSDAKKTMELLIDGIQEKLNATVLIPIGGTMTSMAAIIDRLEDLAERNPSLIEQGFNRTVEGFRTEIHTIRNAIQEPSAKISELNNMIHQLIYRPIARGNAGETVLEIMWTEYFPKDQVEKLGGAGREDLLVRPYLGETGVRFGQAISVERKTGSQKSSGSHRLDAIRHAKAKGASIAMLVYDTQENLVQSLRPVSISKEEGILVVISDLQSGSWKLMRETIEIIEKIIDSSNKNIEDVDTDSIQEIITELSNIIKLIEQVKGNSSKIKSCADEVEQSAVTIKGLVQRYQEKLRIAITGIATDRHNQGHTKKQARVVAEN